MEQDLKNYLILSPLGITTILCLNFSLGGGLNTAPLWLDLFVFWTGIIVGVIFLCLIYMFYFSNTDCLTRSGE